MLVFKTISLLWPFLRELFLGRKTLKEALRTHKGRCVAIAIILASFAFNTWSSQKLVAISRAYIELEKKYKGLSAPEAGHGASSDEAEQLRNERDRLKEENNRLKKGGPSKMATERPVTPQNVEVPVSDRYTVIKNRLDEIRQREEREHL